MNTFTNLSLPAASPRLLHRFALVCISALASFALTVTAHAADLDSLIKADLALRLLVSGPWAPYSFVRLANE